MDKPTFVPTSKFPDDMRIKVGPKYPDKTMELPIKGKDIEGITSNGEKVYCFRCNCQDPYCAEWRCSITGFHLNVNIIKWEYLTSLKN